MRRLLGGTPERVPERYAAASPAARLPLGVPALLTHGGRDDIVPPAMSEEFAAARAAGDECELVIVADEDHFGHLDPANPLWQAVVEWLVTREHALALDAADPLRGFRDRFVNERPAAHLPRRQLARAAARSRPATAWRRSSPSGASGSCRAGRSGSTRPRAPATCSPSTCSARGPAR